MFDRSKESGLTEPSKHRGSSVCGDVDVGDGSSRSSCILSFSKGYDRFRVI
jgi:hypothetical protein